MLASSRRPRVEAISPEAFASTREGVAMSTKRQQTMAKLARERAVKEKRERKLERKRERKLAAGGEVEPKVTEPAD
jgi:hypothetical protein